MADNLLVSKIDTDGVVLGTPIHTLGLSARCTRCLRRMNIKYVEQLSALNRDDLLRIRRLGEMSVDEIMQKLKSFQDF